MLRISALYFCACIKNIYPKIYSLINKHKIENTKNLYFTDKNGFLSKGP